RAVPVPADLRSVPALVNCGAVPPYQLMKATSDCRSNRAPAWLFQTAPSPVPRLPVPVQVTVPALSSVRPPWKDNVLEPLVVNVTPAPMPVWSVPVISPPVQDAAPVTVRVSVPASAPPERVSVPVLCAVPLLKSAKPAVIVSELPRVVEGLVQWTVPPSTMV